MTIDEVIKRVNELYHLSKERALNEEELKEQKEMRKLYIDSVKNNLQIQLDSVDVVEKDGSIHKLTKDSFKR